VTTPAIDAESVDCRYCGDTIACECGECHCPDAAEAAPPCPCPRTCTECDHTACDQCGDCACTGGSCRSTFHHRNERTEW